MKNDKLARQLMQDWLDAAEAGDIDWFEENLLSNFSYFNSGGGRLDKEGIKTGNAIAKTSYELHEVESQTISENAMLATGRYTGRGVIPEELPVSDAMRKSYIAGVELLYSQVWIESHGKWRCLILQTTPVT
ncbi:MAG: nuclear transport factor 2 family protein [Gammaproteobacteria bacterium]|nr:nuclear transport factor 2 family protein [Gammaproteobacteria bacterium]